MQSREGNLWVDEVAFPRVWNGVEATSHATKIMTCSLWNDTCYLTPNSVQPSYCFRCFAYHHHWRFHTPPVVECHSSHESAAASIGETGQSGGHCFRSNILVNTQHEGLDNVLNHEEKTIHPLVDELDTRPARTDVVLVAKDHWGWAILAKGRLTLEE